MSLFSVHLGYMLGALPFPERFARARELGFGAVEIPFPYVLDAEDYARHLARHGLRQISIGAPTTDYRKGEIGLAVNPRQRAAFRSSLEEAARYAKRISCPCVHIFSGCSGGHLAHGAMEEIYCENLSLAASFFAAEGITTLIESINSTDFPLYFLDSFDHARRIINKIGSPHIRLILDIYHLSVMGEDPVQMIADAHRLVEHVQFADFPGRHEPGSATIDFNAIVGVMREQNYRGSAGLEYIPTRAVSEPLSLPEALANYAGLAAGAQVEP
jgi:hydroxypyruvate isomerase